jgi:hypothetical protein
LIKCLLILSVLATNSYCFLDIFFNPSQEAKFGYVHTKTNIRENPTKDSKITGKLLPNKKFSYGFNNNNWVAVFSSEETTIFLNDRKGYVYFPLIKDSVYIPPKNSKKKHVSQIETPLENTPYTIGTINKNNNSGLIGILFFGTIIIGLFLIISKYRKSKPFYEDNELYLPFKYENAEASLNSLTILTKKESNREYVSANIINESGALNQLFKELKSKSIYMFSSLDDIIEFKNNYTKEIEHHKDKISADIKGEVISLKTLNEKLIKQYGNHINKRRSMLKDEIRQLESQIQNIKKGFLFQLKRFIAKKRLKKMNMNLERLIKEPYDNDLNKINDNKNRVNYLSSHFDQELNRRTKPKIDKIEYTYKELTNLSSLICGSIGELKAIDLFRKLPKNYYVINDFQETFNPPLYNKREDERIYSTQLDHVVIGPTGIYVIETKYWSQKSINNNDLFSPIKQLKRGGFALFIIVNNLIKESHLFSKHWGPMKVNITNVLLMMNKTTDEQFQFIKVLDKSSIISYITKRSQIFDENQIKYLVKNLS